MRRRLSSSVILLGLLFCLAGRAEDRLFIQGLQIRGSGRRVQLETHAGQRLDPARIARDVRRLWATGWFDDIRVEAAEAPEGIQLLFTLVEKPRLYLRRVVFEPPSERRGVGIEPGAPIDVVLAHWAAAALRREWVEDGYAEAEVEADLIPVGFQQADLRLRVEPGRRYRVREVRFSGRPGMEPKKLQRALRSTRLRRLLPGLPGLWSGWRLHPPFSERRLQADLERLRSLYLSQGYFDARVGLAEVDFVKDKATITIALESGSSYRVRRTDVVGAEPGEQLEPTISGNFSARELCRCLLRAQQESESHGRLGFAARLEVEAAAEPPWAMLSGASWPSQTEKKDAAATDRSFGKQNWVALTARIETGPAYRVGRIEFRGHHAFSDLTLRRALRLEEQELFHAGRLRRSLARLNRLGFLERVREDHVQVERHPEGGGVNLTIAVKEKRPGRWSLSGPLGPLSISGPLQFTLGSRLPAWGRGPLELSTYYATFSLLAFSQPVLRALSLLPRTRFQPRIALERPYLPGQGWQSGFLLSPQLGWRATLASYALTQAHNAARTALASDPAGAPGLSVPVWWRTGEEANGPANHRPAGVLLCRASPPRWAWLRTAGTTAMNWLLMASLF